MNRDDSLGVRRRWMAGWGGAAGQVALNRAVRVLLWSLGCGVLLALGLARAVVAALLVLFEPLLRLLVLPLAFGSFAIALLFGVLGPARHFPTWGMLALSVGLLWAYWLYMALMVWLMGGRRG